MDAPPNICENFKMGLKKESGQASIMIGVMILTLITFFAFVVNTGMLVHARINLQNAADLAAYSGAAVQARQLTTASYLNFEMRRQFKKFLFRYYVIGNMAQNSFPRPGGIPGPLWHPSGSALDYEVPAVCLFFKNTDNFCKVDKLKKLVLPPTTRIDNINEVLRNQLIKLDDLRKENCGQIGKINRRVLMSWLFNPDVAPPLITTTTDPAYQKIIQLTQGLTQGLGLVPREVIMALRMETVETYLNHKAESLNFEGAAGLRANGDPENERSVNAFYSAYNTLGETLWNPESIELVEMLPPGPRRDGAAGSAMAKFKEIGRTFDTYFVAYFDEAGNVLEDLPPSGNPNDCIPGLVPVTIRFPLTVGFVKDPTVLTYYAVKLKARARLLLSPFGEIEMRAYASAQPFGSRLGPPDPPDSAEWARAIVPANLVTVLSRPVVGFVPNLPVIAGETAGRGQGWDKPQTLGLLFNKMKLPPVPGSPGGIVDQVGTDELERGTHAAMVPNPAEAGRYNILSLLHEDSFEDAFFGPDAENPKLDPSRAKTALLWAPVFGKSVRNPDQELKDRVGNLFANATGDPYLAELRDSLQDALAKYMIKLQSGRDGEPLGNFLPNGQKGRPEGYNVVPVADPFLTPAGQPENFPVPNFMIDPTNPVNYRTSWNQVGDAALESQGRAGYSVKFVSFDSLRKGEISPDGRNSFGNFLRMDAESSLDIPFVRH